MLGCLAEASSFETPVLVVAPPITMPSSHPLWGAHLKNRAGAEGIPQESKLQIGNDVWIGDNVAVMAVNIGDGAVVGAGSVVTIMRGRFQ